MAKATGQGRTPHKAPKGKPDSGKRQSSNDPSAPNARAPKPKATPGGEPKATNWGGHLQQ
jgi:hypothetical protein